MSLIHIIAIPFALVFFVLLVRYLFERSRAGRQVSTDKRTQALIERAERLHAHDDPAMSADKRTHDAESPRPR